MIRPKDIERVKFYYLEKSFSFSSRTTLKKFILTLLKTEKIQVDHINYVFCSDEYLLLINQKFLEHDTYTDIITFQYTKQNEPVVADIYISVDRVKENAKRYGSSFAKEFYRVLFHGALHLAGYKDKSLSDTQTMRKKEDHYLNLYVSRETKRERKG